jgi:hypothetical protein
MAYNLLSCLLHGKPTPTFRDESPIPLSEIQDGEIYIKGYIADFSYSTYIADVFTKLEIVKLYLAETNDYFRLQVFRVLVELYELRSKIDDPLLKYIDEQFHINNDYVFYLDLTKFNVVPSFVLPKCDDFLKREKVL